MTDVSSKILVDTSIRIGRLQARDVALVTLPDAGRGHFHAIEVLGLGDLKKPAILISTLSCLPGAAVVTDSDVWRFIGEQSLVCSSNGTIAFCDAAH